MIRIGAALILIIAAVMLSFVPNVSAVTYPDRHGLVILNTVIKPSFFQGGFRVNGPITHGNLKIFGESGKVFEEFGDINVAAGSFTELWMKRDTVIHAGDYLLGVLTDGNGNVQANASTYVEDGAEDANQVSFELQVLVPCRNLVTVFGDPKTTYSIPELNFSRDLGVLTPGTTVEVVLPEGVGYLKGTAPDWVDIVLDGVDPNNQLLPRHLVEKIPGSWLECLKPATATWTPSPIPSVTPTAKPSDTPTASPTALPSATPSNTPPPTATATVTAIPTAKPPVPGAAYLPWLYKVGRWFFVGAHYDPHCMTNQFPAEFVPVWQTFRLEEAFLCPWPREGRYTALAAEGHVLDYELAPYGDLSVVKNVYVDNVVQKRPSEGQQISVNWGKVVIFIRGDGCDDCINAEVFWREDIKATGLLPDMFATQEAARKTD